jgi:hypothetical protein
MPEAYTSSVMWVSRRKRGHGSTAVPVSPLQNPSILSPGDTFSASWVPSSIPWENNTTLNFAFWSVTGGRDGSIATRDNPPSPVKVGDVNIMATAWYILSNTIPTDQFGLLVDAFDINIGNFVDDDFVEVKDSNQVTNANLTFRANNEGFVPTAFLEYINAFSSIHSVPFQSWQVIGTESVENSKLVAAKDSAAIAFAFYQTPAVSSVKVPYAPPEGWFYVSPGVMVGGGGWAIGPGGIPHPVDPWGPLTAKLLSTVAILSVSQNLSEKIKSAAIDLAGKHVASIAEEIKSMGKK